MDISKKIEEEKALFWPDFKRMEQQLEQQLRSEKLSATEKLDICNKLTSLSYRWTENGVRDISVVKGMRDNIAANLKMLRETDQQSDEPGSVYVHEKSQLAKLDKILAEAAERGIESEILRGMA